MNNSSFARQAQWHLILLLLLLPLLFINQHDWHNWGGDFAQYLGQAKSIVQGILPAQTGYISTQYRTDLPAAYPIGFSLLLAPVYAQYGLDMEALTFFMAILTVLAGLLVFIFLNKTSYPLAAVLMTLAMMYNPWMIDFKTQVLSDVPFLLFFLSGFLLLDKKQLTVPIILIAGVAWGGMLSIRVAGIAFLAAAAVKALFGLWKKKITAKDATGYFAVIGIAICIYILLNKALFPVPSSGYPFDMSNLSFHVQRNFNNLTDSLKGFLTGTENPVSWRLIFSYVVLASAISGVVFSVRKRQWGLMEWCIVFYLTLILLVPWNAGFRYLLPVFPFFLFYLLSGIEGITTWLKIKVSYLLIPLAMIFFILYVPEVAKLQRHHNQPGWSHYETASMEALHFIRDSIPDDAIILFEKPRVLALYTGCKSLAFPSNPELASAFLQQYKIDYFAEHADLYHEDYSIFLNQYKEKERIWSNEKCVIYKNLSNQ